MQPYLSLAMAGVAAFTTFAMASLASANSLPEIPLTKSVAALPSPSSAAVEGAPVCNSPRLPPIKGTVARETWSELVVPLKRYRADRGLVWTGGYCKPVVVGTIASTPKGHFMKASFYSSGRRTASGERFDPVGFTAASKTLPFGTRLQVTNPTTGRSVTLRINDRGPFIVGRDLDLTRGAAAAIGMIKQGTATLNIVLLSGPA